MKGVRCMLGTTRKARKGMAVWLIALLLVAAGCGGNQADNRSGTNGGNQTSGGTSSGTSGGGQTEKVTIEFFNMKADVVDLFDQYIADFHAKQSNITVEQNNVPTPENVWQMRVSTGDAPEVFTHYPHNAVFQQMSKEGRVVDLTGDPLLANVNPAIVELSQIDGKNYLVPIALATLGVYYNVDIFNELGLDIPQTYDEFLAAAQKIRDAGITPFYFHDKDWNGIRQEVVFKMGLQIPGVEEFLDQVMNGQAHITDNPDFRPFAQRLLDLRQYGQQDALGTSYDDALREFANGNAAMWFTGIWAIKTIRDSNPDLNFSMFPLPAEKAEDTRLQISVDTAIGMPADGKHPEAARTFIEFMSSQETVQKYIDAAGYPSAIQGIANNNDKIERLNDIITAGKVYPTIERVWPPGVNSDVGKATQEMFASGDIDAYLQKLDAIFFDKYNK